MGRGTAGTMSAARVNSRTPRSEQSGNRAIHAGQRLQTPAYQQALKQLQGGLLIDMDDTLNSNQPLYDQAHSALRAVFTDLAERPVEDSLTYTNRCRAINNAWLPTLGYTPKQWRHCAQLTAEEIAGRALSKTEKAQVAAAAEIALGPGQLLDGVRDSLQALHAAGVPMLLKTKGELTIQQQKIAAHHLDDIFHDHIEIVSAKTPDSFRELAERHGLSQPVSIGDSRTSDIQPALDCGFRGLLIDYGWRWDDPDGTTAHLERVGSFAEAVLLLADEQLPQ